MKKHISARTASVFIRHQGQSGAAKPALVAGIVVALLLAAGGWWYWSSRGSASGAGPAGAASVPAGSASRAGGPGGGSGGPGGGGRFGGANRIQPVSVGTVRRQDVRVTVNAIGSIAAANTAVVRAKVSGELKAIYFREGQLVKAGSVVAEIDPQPFRIALAQAQGTLVRDQAQLANARLDLARYKDLIAKDAAPKQQLDTQQALVAQLEGTVMTDQAQVDNAKLQLSYTRVTAPISGLAGLKQVDVGNTVQTSDANGVLSIAQTHPVNVVFSVPDTQLPQIQKQMKAAKPMAVEAWDRDQKNKLADGVLASTDNSIDSTTGTIKLKAQFANAKDELFPNQFVNVRLQVDNISDTLAVPSAAVLRGTQGTYVYLVNADKTVSVRRIRVGANDGDWVSIQADLKPGDKVVTDGADRLREGAQVEVVVPLAPSGGFGGRRRDGASAPAGGASGASGGGNFGGRGAGGPAAAGADAGPGAGPVAGEGGTRRSPAGAEAGQGRPGGEGRPGGPGGEGRPGGPGGRPGEGPPPRGDGPPPQRGDGPPPGANAGGGDMPPWFSRLPPEMQEKFKAMSPQEREAWIQKRREERQRQQGNQ